MCTITHQSVAYASLLWSVEFKGSILKPGAPGLIHMLRHAGNTCLRADDKQKSNYFHVIIMIMIKGISNSHVILYRY